MFAVFARVEAGELLLSVTCATEQRTHREQERGQRRRTIPWSQYGNHLHTEQPRDQTTGRQRRCIHGLRREDTGEQRSNNSGDAVTGEHVERIVHARFRICMAV